MDIKTRLENSMKDAMRSGDDVTKRTVRMAMAAIKQVEIDRQIKLDEGAIQGIIQKEIKTRRESLDEARQAKRADLESAAEAEISVLRAFLPEEIGDEELDHLASAAVLECNASSPADMGKVMKILLPRVQGKASGDRVSQAVRRILQK